MRIVFFGTPEIAVPTLAAVAEKHTVTAVVCQPDRPQGRSSKLIPPPVKVWAEANGVAVHQPEKLNDGNFEAWLKEQAPEMGIVAAYGRLLKQPILDVPAKGWLNLHPSLLPRHRGPSPIQTAILEGDPETGVTIMQVVLEMDAGDICLQRTTAIAPEETSAELFDRLAAMGAEAMLEAIAQVENGTASFTPQDLAQVTVTKLIEKQDGVIHWNAPARRIHNQIRACVPWPVAYSLFNGEVCRIHRATLAEMPSGAEPGTVVSVEADRILVATGDGVVALLTIQMPGKRAMAVRDFLLGRKVTPGERFEEPVS